MKTKTITTLSAILITTWMTYAYINMPTLIDKMNEQKITYQTEQKSLEKANKTLRIQSQAIDKKITDNSNKWNKLNGQIKQIDVTLKMLKTWKLDQ